MYSKFTWNSHVKCLRLFECPNIWIFHNNRTFLGVILEDGIVGVTIPRGKKLLWKPLVYLKDLEQVFESCHIEQSKSIDSDSRWAKRIPHAALVRCPVDRLRKIQFLSYLILLILTTGPSSTLTTLLSLFPDVSFSTSASSIHYTSCLAILAWNIERMTSMSLALECGRYMRMLCVIDLTSVSVSSECIVWACGRREETLPACQLHPGTGQRT